MDRCKIPYTCFFGVSSLGLRDSTSLTALLPRTNQVAAVAENERPVLGCPEPVMLNRKESCSDACERHKHPDLLPHYMYSHAGSGSSLYTLS